jgi:hypothetical protein
VYGRHPSPLGAEPPGSYRKSASHPQAQPIGLEHSPRRAYALSLTIHGRVMKNEATRCEHLRSQYVRKASPRAGHPSSSQRVLPAGRGTILGLKSAHISPSPLRERGWGEGRFICTQDHSLVQHTLDITSRRFGTCGRFSTCGRFLLIHGGAGWEQ